MLQSLEHRRLIVDLVMCFNIVRNIKCLNSTDYFNINTNNSLRGRSFVPIVKTHIRKSFFAYRIVPIWNSLPNIIFIFYLIKLHETYRVGIA